MFGRVRDGHRGHVDGGYATCLAGSSRLRESSDCTCVLRTCGGLFGSVERTRDSWSCGINVEGSNGRAPFFVDGMERGTFELLIQLPLVEYPMLTRTSLQSGLYTRAAVTKQVIRKR